MELEDRRWDCTTAKRYSKQEVVILSRITLLLLLLKRVSRKSSSPIKLSHIQEHFWLSTWIDQLLLMLDQMNPLINLKVNQ